MKYLRNVAGYTRKDRMRDNEVGEKWILNLSNKIIKSRDDSVNITFYEWKADKFWRKFYEPTQNDNEI
jgi:hypothetical protein